ncbi:hypothetical protein FACS1894132_09150 [Clostridia bacterium]|nr:hypothetical protein FACS1894132_09150 [Clostridia bacterium]
MGHKRLALESGEDPVNSPIEYIIESINTIYSIKHKNGAIRRVNVNIAATTVEEYTMLRDAGIGTYILFQETYNKKKYEKMHPSGPKSNYDYHTTAMDRAMDGGIDDVGLGVLYGLSGYKYDFVGILMHAEHLEAVKGVGPHTISVPRIRDAEDIDSTKFKNGVPDDIFQKIVAILRIAVPYTGMIISTRESQTTREKILDIGVSQISGGSSTSVGGYDERNIKLQKHLENNAEHDVLKKQADISRNTSQFEISDSRTLDEVVNWLLELGFIPSFCTACYREGRTGDRFMSLVKNGQIANCCLPNALITLKEYLMDYATPDTKAKGEKLLQNELFTIPNEKVRKLATENIAQIENGERDFRF